MALPSAYNEISINTIYNHIGSASNYGYEGGYALRALSLHGRFTLNDTIFNIEDRISDFYSKDFTRTKATRLQGGWTTAWSAEEIDPDEICNALLIQQGYWRATSEETRFIQGQTFTAFTDNTLSRVVTYKAFKDTLGRVWFVNGYGLAQVVVPDCSKFEVGCDSPYKYYWTAIDCENGEYIGVVHTDCVLTSGRHYAVDQSSRLPIEFSGYMVVRIGEPTVCDGTNNYAAIEDCRSARCMARLKGR